MPDNDGNEEEARFRTPFLRDERGQRHEQRNDRNRTDGVGDHLDQSVDPAAEIAGYSADNQRQDERDQNAERADGERGVDGVEGPGENILAGLVGPEQMYAALVDAEQMRVEASGREYRNSRPAGVSNI